MRRPESSAHRRMEPGEKALLAVQATRMLWSPVPRESDSSGSGTARLARKTIEPVFVLDLWEHAYLRDFGVRGREQWVETVLDNTSWKVIEERCG